MRGKGERLRWSGRIAGVMKRKAKVKRLVEGKELPPKRAYDTDSSTSQSGDTGGPGWASGVAPHLARHVSRLPRQPNQSRSRRLLPPSSQDKEKGKEKLEEDEAAAASTMAVSASLMPPIWDKTIPYDGESFHLEYMDLDEFLLENGIPASPTHLAQNLLLPVAELEGKESASSSTASPPSSSTAVFQPSETVSSTESSLEKDRETPSPIDPSCVEVDVNFNPDPADLVLSSVPGGELFNPRKHKFAEEDLKPQPMIKKAKKVFVPDEQKDEKYWTRRKKNNVAAKRSRDARRLKENQITIRAAFLEKENTALRTEVAELRKEVGKCKTIVSKYETKYGPL
ncbi:thyrotroph embryonic factor isoform 1-T1 [Hipposideros larvatus]